MGTWDLAIGVSQELCNQISLEVYQALYPRVFTGHEEIPEKEVSCDWAVKEAPTFDFTPSEHGKQFYRERLIRGHKDKQYFHAVMKHINNSPVFEMKMSVFELVLTYKGQRGEPIDIDVTMLCRVDVNPEAKTVSIVPFDARTETTIDPFTDAIIQNYLLPTLTRSMAQMFSNLQIPPLEWMGISFAAPMIIIEDRYVIAVSQMEAIEDRSKNDRYYWPSGKGFFILVSESAMVAAARVGIEQINRETQSSGEVSADPFFAQYHYDMTLANPQINIVGPDLHVAFSLSGSLGASAGMHLGCIGDLAAGVGLGASAEPNPGGLIKMNMDAANNLFLHVDTVDAFTIFVYPEGGVIEWITGAFLSLIIDAIVTPLTPALSQIIAGMTFSIMKIDDITLQEEGKTIVIQPSNMLISNQGGMICVDGQAVVSIR